MSTVVTEGQRIVDSLVKIVASIPYSLIALLGRLGLALLLWQSGQSKVDGFTVNVLTGDVELGMPTISERTLYWFAEEYPIPLVSPIIAATLITLLEHVCALLLTLGFATRLAAFGVVLLTVIMQLFVHPDAFATHATWASLGLLLLSQGAGSISVDHLRR